jgi:hypothetical protein
MTMKVRILLLVILTLVSVNAVSAQTTAFTYQGKLVDNGNLANGNYDMQFKLFDTATVGTGHQIGAGITNSSVSVTAGIFTVQLDFGAGAFSGPPRFLEIGVRPMGSPNPYTLLSPRQAVTSTPYSVRSLNSSMADVLSSACVGCVTSTQVGSVSGSAVTGTIPVASVPAGSGNYVQNTTSQQAASNFNISGNGTAGGTLTGNIVNATTQFNIGVDHALSLGIVAGVFAGRLAGASNTTGSGNSFFGDSAGRFNTTAGNNSFFGREAGTLNTASDNSFFGAFAGNSNTTGTRNSFFGRTSGDANQTGNDNSFFGSSAGRFNTASFNSFFGSGAGDSTTSGANNSFFGYNAGAANLTGANNAFFGYSAGLVSTGSFNSFFGSNAGNSTTTGANNSIFGYNAGQANQNGEGNTFFGYNAGSLTTVGGNSFFGKNAGELNTTGERNSFFGYQAGQSNNTTLDNSFFGYSAGRLTRPGSALFAGFSNSFFGSRAGELNLEGQGNSFFGAGAGDHNSTGSDNIFIGRDAGNSNTLGDNNTVVGANADVGGGSLTHAAAIGADAVVNTSNTIVLGRGILDKVIVGGLQVDGNATFHPGQTVHLGITHIDGALYAHNAGGAGNTNLCIDTDNNDLVITCASSLRFKTDVKTFTPGIDIVRRLRPIAFTWKSTGVRDLGFAAEEVEQIEPLLATYKKGELLGVKYDQITTVLVNAVKEQQRIIEQQQQLNQAQQKQLERQQRAIETLRNRFLASRLAVSRRSTRRK